MQTFLPYRSIIDSARCLDNKRLGKQRSEAIQILELCLGLVDNKWRHHPAVLMWKGYEPALFTYACVINHIWVEKRFDSTKTSNKLCNLADVIGAAPVVYPVWFGDERFFASHRANLLRKNPDFYGRYGWTEDASMPYFWPTKEGY